MKICSKCKQIKNLIEFCKDKNRKDGLRFHCRQCSNEATAAYRKANPKKVKASNAAWDKANPDKVKSRSASYRKANPKKVKASNAAWNKANPDKKNAFAAKRRAAKLQRTPKWLTREDYKEIQRFYAEAYKQGLTVDHIIPLQGKNVSGLHVPWNLQILTKSENSKKGNKL